MREGLHRHVQFVKIIKLQPLNWIEHHDDRHSSN